MSRRVMSYGVVLGAVILCGSLAVVAEAPSKEIYAKVPFQFVVGEKIFMPGDYRIMLLDQGRSSIKVTSWKGTVSVEVPVIGRLTRQGHSDPAATESLVFQRVQEIGFLSEVWVRGDGFLVQKTPGAQTIIAAQRQDKE